MKITICLLITLSVIPISFAQTVMKAPFGCAQNWDIWTYATHSDIDSLDMHIWKDREDKSNPNSGNITYGQFVLASAAGRITRDDLLPDDEWGLVRRVNIQHTDTWSTVYLHNVIEPELFAVGRKVAMGEVIGLAGRSGTDPDGWHIHYSQKNNDEIVRARFDNVAVDSHGGRGGLVGASGGDQEQLRSSNCTARSFAHWRDQNQTYLFRYHPHKGQGRITQLTSQGEVVGNTWTNDVGDWGKSFTDFVTYKVDGEPHLIRYNARNGRATFFQVNSGGDGLTRIANTTDWRAGWTLLQQIKHEQLNFILAYDSRTGYRQMLQIAADGASVAVDESAYDIKGWTHALPFDRSQNQYLLLYKAATGRLIIRRMDREILFDSDGDPTDRIRIVFTDVYDAYRNPGWTHLQLVRQDGELYMLGYKSTSGNAAIWRIGTLGNGPQKTASMSMSNKWDIITALPHPSTPRLMFYGVDAGDTKFFSLNNNGSGLTAELTLNWQGGWR